MPDCQSCHDNRTPANVPFYVHESEMFRMERVNCRLLAACLLLLTALVLSNLSWAMHDHQTETTEAEVTEAQTEG